MGNPGILNKFLLSVPGTVYRALLSSYNSKVIYIYIFTGKTTVARLFGEILVSLGLRVPGKFVETSGQTLLQGGSNKFSPVLKSVTPGLLFVDEVYQLDPKGSGEGRAITNMLMEATETNREILTVIVAGYRDDVMEKWVSYNPGISSRFPFEVTFEDFNTEELYSIILRVVRESKWEIQQYYPPNDPLKPVNVAMVMYLSYSFLRILPLFVLNFLQRSR